MPRDVQETLLGVQWAIRQIEVPETDERGNVIHQLGNGAPPRMKPQWVLDLTEQAPHERRTIHVPFDKDAKDRLVEALTGGIQVASQLPPSI
jgi:hypothetical protein